MDTIEIVPVCAICDAEMAEVEPARCVVCERYGRGGRRHFRCENPRCPSALMRGKTTICAEVAPGAPMA